MPFAVAAAAVGAVASSSAASKAAKAQQRSTEASVAEQQRQFEQTREDYAPYRAVGRYALGQLVGPAGTRPTQERENFDPVAYLRENPNVAADAYWRDDPYGHYVTHGRNEGKAFTWTADAQEKLRRADQPQGGGLLEQSVTAEDVMQDPGYQFGLQQGQQALDRKIAAMGGRVSGAALKAAARYGTDYATTGYGAAYQRRQDRLNRLQALAGIGQTATGSSAAAGAQAAGNISGALESQGAATGAARIAQGNIWGGAANQIAGYYMDQQNRQRAGDVLKGLYGSGGYNTGSAFGAYDPSGYGMGGPGYDTAAIGALPTRGGA